MRVEELARVREAQAEIAIRAELEQLEHSLRIEAAWLLLLFEELELREFVEKLDDFDS